MIDKKTMTLLGVLIAVVLGVAYYFYFYEPYTKSIEELEIQLTEEQNKLATLNTKLATERMLDDSILAVTENINDFSKKMFVDLDQEESLQILSNLNKKGLIFDSIKFAGGMDEATGSKYVEQELTFSASYHDIMSLLRKIRRYDKKITVVDASMNISQTDYEVALANLDSEDVDLTLAGEQDIESEESDDTSGGETGEFENGESEEALEKKTPGDTITTVMRLRFRSLPTLAKLGVEQMKLIKDIKTGRNLAKGPFAKYEDFIRNALEEKRKSEEIAQNIAVPIMPETTTETTTTTTFDYANYKPRSLVTDFEEGSFFFVGSDSGIGGNVTRSKTRKSGGYSAELSFDFLTPKAYNAAYIVFGNSQLKLHNQPESIVVQAYAYESSNHSIGLIVLDSAGREHRVLLATTVDWTDWKELQVNLPDSISYPCVIQRLYVEGVGFEQKTNGKYLFDMMEVEYPAPGETEPVSSETSENN